MKRNRNVFFFFVLMKSIPIIYIDIELDSFAYVDWKLMISPLVLSRTAKYEFLVIASKIPFLGGIDSSERASKWFVSGNDLIAKDMTGDLEFDTSFVRYSSDNVLVSNTATCYKYSRVIQNVIDRTSFQLSTILAKQERTREPVSLTKRYQKYTPFRLNNPLKTQILSALRPN